MGIDRVRDPAAALELPEYPGARLRRSAAVADPKGLGPSIHAAHELVGAVVRALRDVPPAAVAPPTDPLEWRRQLLRRGTPDLEAVVDDLWERGIPVVHIPKLPSPKFQGMACIIDGRPVVVLGWNVDVSAKHLFYCAHEAGHIANGDCRPGAPVVDEERTAEGASEMELQADRYALLALNGTPQPEAIGGRNGLMLANAARAVGLRRRVDPGHLVLAWGKSSGSYAVELTALKHLGADTGAVALLRARLEAHLDLEGASDSDRALLRWVVPGAADATPTH